MIKNLLKHIDADALLHNAIIIKKFIYPNKLCAVVKSDGYGHGIDKTVKSIDVAVDYFAVSDIKEAMQIRRLTSKPILVIGALDYSTIKLAVENNIDLSVFCKKDVLRIAKNVKNGVKKCNIHIKVDSGMHRLGVSYCSDFFEIVNIIQNNNNINLRGVFTHLGSDKGKRTNKQLEKFNLFTKNLPEKVIRHFANSDNSLSTPLKINQMSRIGLSLYGYGKFPNLIPALSVYAKIINISFVKKGSFVGYGNKHKAKKDMLVAVLAIGYANGLMRCYHKKGFVIINNKKAKIVADICMSMTIVDITKIANVKVGEFAIILGESKNLKITAQTIAKKCKTIPYEILTNFDAISCTKKKPLT